MAPVMRDPVCGKEIDGLRARAVGIWGGRTYYFCSAEHRAAFAKDPAAYRDRSGPAPETSHPSLPSPPIAAPQRKATPLPSVTMKASPPPAPTFAETEDTVPQALSPIGEDESEPTLVPRSRSLLYAAVAAAIVLAILVVLIARR